MLEKLFLGNTLEHWAIAAAILLAVAILGRLISVVAKSMAARLGSPFVAAMVAGTSAPLTWFVCLLGLRVAAESLVLSSGVHNLLGKSVTFASVLVITWIISNVYDAVHKTVFEPYASRPDASIDLHLFVVLRTIVNVLVWVVGISSGLNSVGFEVSAVLAGLGIGGMALALASQDTVANIFGGVLILLQRPFKLGERVEVAGVNGWVVQIGLRNTLIKNWYGQSVLIPNKKFTDSIVTNIDSQSVYYQEVRLRLDPLTSPQQVELALQILKDIVRDVEHMHPTPWVMLDKFGAGFIEVEFWYGIMRWQPIEAAQIPNEYEKICRTKTKVNLEIMQRFAQAGLRFAIPLAVHVPGDPASYLGPSNPPSSAPKML